MEIKLYTKSFFKSIINLIRYGNANSVELWNQKLKKYNKYKHYSEIFELLPKNKIFFLLDIGCANGDGCEYIKQNFPLANISGFDQSETGITNAKSKNTETYYFRDYVLSHHPLDYDFILLIDILEHFYNPLVIVDKYLKHTKNLIIRVPFKQELPFKFLRKHKSSFDENTFSSYNSKLIKKIKDECLYSKSKLEAIFILKPTKPQ